MMSSGGGGESQPHLRVSAGTAQSINNSVRYFSFLMFKDAIKKSFLNVWNIRPYPKFYYFLKASLDSDID